MSSGKRQATGASSAGAAGQCAPRPCGICAACTPHVVQHLRGTCAACGVAVHADAPQTLSTRESAWGGAGAGAAECCTTECAQQRSARLQGHSVLGRSAAPQGRGQAAAQVLCAPALTALGARARPVLPRARSHHSARSGLPHCAWLRAGATKTRRPLRRAWQRL
jgi:hypothetical protein